MNIKITAKDLGTIHPFLKNRFANYNEDSWSRPSIKVISEEKLENNQVSLICELLGDNSGHYAHVMNYWKGVKLKQIGYSLMANGMVNTDVKPLEVAEDVLEIIKVENAN